jgi:hypothetical protein
MDLATLPTGYIAIGFTLVIAAVFYVLWSKQRNEIAAQLKVLQGTRDDLEKLRQEVAAKANQVSILTGEIARIERIAEQQGSESTLSDIQVLAHQLRAELQKANDRLAKDEETFAAFASTLEAMKMHQEKLDVALSSDKFFELVDAKENGELLLYLRNSVDEALLKEVQEEALRTVQGTACLYVLSMEPARQMICVNKFSDMIDQAESKNADDSELLEASAWMLAEAPLHTEAAIKLMERLSKVALKKDDLPMAEKLDLQLSKAHTKLGTRVNSPALRRGLTNVSRVFEQHKLTDKLESIYRHIHELNVVDPDADKARMGMNIKKLAQIYVDQERYHEAEAMYDIVLNVLTQTEGPENRDVILHLRDFAKLYLKLNKLSEVNKTYLTLLSLKIISEYEDLVALICEIDEAAAVFKANNKTHEAQKLYETCLAALENTEQEVSLKKALEILSKLMSLYEEDEQTVDPETLRTACERSLRATLTLAELQRLTKQFEQSQQSFEASLKIASKTFGGESGRVADVLEKYAILAEETSNSEKARALTERAERIRKEEQPKTPQTA